MTTSATIGEQRTRWGACIDGVSEPGPTADTFAVIEPATGRTIAEVDAGGEGEVDRAVASARRAFERDWPRRTARERGAMLREAATVIREHADELARLETREVGKPLRDSADFDVQFAIASFEYFAGLVHTLTGELIDQGPVDAHVLFEPYGVVGAILPFNWPPIHLAAKAAPALAAGNTVVVKPGEQAPTAVLRMVELLAEVLPPGALNAVPGFDAGPALARHPGVDRLTFTGSTGSARRVLEAAAENLVPATMELGGKNALIVFPDADLDDALAGALEGMYFNQGEACTSTSRLLLHDELHDEFLERFARASERLRVGDGLEADTDLGPMVDARQRQRVLDYIELGEREGAHIVARGRVPDDPRLSGGYWVPPTVFAGVTPDMRIAQEEIFGPVCTVMRFASDSEAFEIANGTPYGLTAAVYTSDAERMTAAGRELEAGLVFINNYYRRAMLGSPFGGVKHSGYGREGARETLHEFVRSKNVRLPSGQGEIPRWAAVDHVLGGEREAGRRDGGEGRRAGTT